ncbi:MAG TPA: hypothetical protein VF487_12755 [Chitinophagaceae bacterium]
MRQLIVLFLFVSFSCQSLTEKEKRSKDISGDWLILYADHQLKSNRERDLYAKMQDSIIGLTGLKLVSFSRDGRFRQMDSLHTNGQWIIMDDNRLEVAGGGKGFDLFRAEFVDYKKGIIQLAEYIKVSNESIKLVWNLKRINSDPAARLLEAERNTWRIKPSHSENDDLLKKRLASILNYYSDYFGLVTRESSYFISGRVILPFKFYQHAMGLKSFNSNNDFTNLFFDEADAQTAYQYLQKALYDLRDDFPSGKNFVDEYAKFMKLMAEELEKKK